MGKATEAVFVSAYPDLELKMIQTNRIVERGVVMLDPGRNLKFINGEYRTSDESEIAYIRNHRWYGTRIQELGAEDLKLTGEIEPEPQTVRFSSEDAEDQGKDEGDGLVRLPCGFVDGEGTECDYVAEDETEEGAQRRLNAHKTAKGHRD